jgi:23S rRNA (cytosine1962-C5)-methyltransferase
MPAPLTAVISARGAQRWARGHPWVFRGDVVRQPNGPAGAVAVTSERGRPLGSALWSPTSEISLRFIERDPNTPIDAVWWRARIGSAVARRQHLAAQTTACRLVHGEADGCPSLVCDRYDRWLVVQLLSAGLEAFREVIVAALVDATGAAGVLARHDVTVRDREGLARDVELLTGDVPDEIEIVEHGVRYLAAPRTGQKTGAFLDQRENRVLIGGRSRGRALDCFSYHGSFALHLARGADHVTALDTSGPALARARENAARNGFTNIETLEADAFDYLKAAERGRERFDTIVLDPPAFAKSRAAVPAAIRGYKEINLRAMRLLSPGGTLFTASCSFHLSKPAFLEMLADAAGDSGRTIVLRAIVGQPSDHPEVLTIPETGYIKGALLSAV